MLRRSSKFAGLHSFLLLVKLTFPTLLLTYFIANNMMVIAKVTIHYGRIVKALLPSSWLLFSEERFGPEEKRLGSVKSRWI